MIDFNIKNYTGKNIEFIYDRKTGESIMFPSIGNATFFYHSEQIGKCQYQTHSIPILKNNITKYIDGLPDPEPNTLFIVSESIACFLKNRSDLVYIDETDYVHHFKELHEGKTNIYSQFYSYNWINHCLSENFDVNQCEHCIHWEKCVKK